MYHSEDHAMPNAARLADQLNAYLRRSNSVYTPGLLGKLSGVPKTTIVNWLDGRVTRPRRWQDLLRVADALRLDHADVGALLAAAGFPSLDELRSGADGPDAELFASWNGHLPRHQPSLVMPPPGMPSPATPLIGREKDLAALRSRLSDDAVRLVTITGPAGVGKTRLALQVAYAMAGEFRDGIVLVLLAALADPQQVAVAIAAALGITADGSGARERLLDALRPKRALLVLDNFEHLLPATQLVASIIATAPSVRVLVTSRAVLQVYGEHNFALAPLRLPDLNRLPPVAELADLPAVALFVQRAQAADPGFALSSANARAVAEICVRLDGLPLSIELAAARSKLLTPHGLLERLASRLGLLTWGARDLPERHQTLRATLDWSYRLLDKQTQVLFARLGVFVGSFTAAAAEAVCWFAPLLDEDNTAEPEPGTHFRVLDGLMVLLNNSLLHGAAEDEEDERFRMLETVREYALERLGESLANSEVRRRHAAYAVALAEMAESALASTQQLVWLTMLDREDGNLRAALAWLYETGDYGGVARLAGALRPFWMIRGRLSEGRAWLDRALSAEQAIAPAIQARAALAAGHLARQQGDYAASVRYLQTSLILYREMDDPNGAAAALGYLGVLAYDRRNFAQAEALHQESLQLKRAVGDRWGEAATLGNLGEVSRQQGAFERAEYFHHQSHALFERLGDQWGTAVALLNLGITARDRGDVGRARRLLVESLDQLEPFGDKEVIAECLEGLASLSVEQGADEQAAVLGGAAEALRLAAGSPLSAADRQRTNKYFEQARCRSTSRFEQAWAKGYALALDEALAYARNGGNVAKDHEHP